MEGEITKFVNTVRVQLYYIVGTNTDIWGLPKEKRKGLEISIEKMIFEKGNE